MEFEEIKKIWDKQNNEQLYAINEEAMLKFIERKKRRTEKITSNSEYLLILVNTAVGLSILLNNKGSIYLYLLSGIMLITAIVITYTRWRRKKYEKELTDTILGGLKKSLNTASYQVKLSQAIRLTVIPFAAISALSVWQSTLSYGIIAVSILIWFATGWEHRIYVRKKNELEQLHQKLMQE